MVWVRRTAGDTSLIHALLDPGLGLINAGRVAATRGEAVLVAYLVSARERRNRTLHRCPTPMSQCITAYHCGPDAVDTHVAPTWPWD